MAENDDEVDPELAEMLKEHGIVRSGEVDAKTGEEAGEKPKKGERPEAEWAIDENRILVRVKKTAQERFDEVDRKDAMKREGVRRFIRPENAMVVVRRLPELGGTTHCILRGDFVLADLLPYALEGWTCPHLRIATLSMNEKNAELLAGLRRSGQVQRLTLVLSHYFEAVNKSTVYFEIRNILEGLADFVTMRSHAKVICCPRERAGESDWLVMEGSANLRSSDNLEQMTIFNDREVHDFHAEWIDHVVANPPASHRKKAKATQSPETPETR